MLDANRLFPAEATARAVAVKLYETVRDLPIISPHGHTDPRWFAENKPFPNPAALFIQPDHYIFRMLYSQGISLESLGIPQVDGKETCRSARGVADFREELLPVSRHAYTAVDRLFVCGELWVEGPPVGGKRGRILRGDCEEAADAGVPAARTVRSVQHRGAFHNRRRVRFAGVSPGDQSLRMEGPGAADVPAGCGGRRGVHRASRTT